jgi:putative aldouronate transport system permease protein
MVIMINMKNKISLGEILSNLFIYSILIVVVLVCLLPFVYILSVSLSTDKALSYYGGTLIPKEFSLNAYIFLFNYGSRIFNAYKSTLIITLGGTFIGLLVTSGMAYPLSRKDLPFRSSIMKYVFFSMLFGGGLIPFYIVVNSIGLSNSYLALILPGCYTSWNMILMRNFFMSLPQALEESAYIDGANEIQILFKIILPLSMPIMATIGLFLAIGFWNTWFGALLFLSDPEKWPLMLFLKEVLQSSRSADKLAGMTRAEYPPSESLRMAVVLICTVPILLVYPFVQKYFVKGVMIGSIKG